MMVIAASLNRYRVLNSAKRFVSHNYDQVWVLFGLVFYKLF